MSPRSRHVGAGALRRAPCRPGEAAPDPPPLAADTGPRSGRSRRQSNKLHAAQLISDDELFAVEDCVADFHEAKATFEVATLEIAGANRAVGKVHKLVLLSEGVAKDPMLARQLRRKFV